MDSSRHKRWLFQFISFLQMQGGFVRYGFVSIGIRPSILGLYFWKEFVFKEATGFNGTCSWGATGEKYKGAVSLDAMCEKIMKCSGKFFRSRD